MWDKIVTFLIRKKVETATGSITQTSKTKIFMCIEAILRLIEFISPYLGHPVMIPDGVHKLIYTLAGLSYAERQGTSKPA